MKKIKKNFLILILILATLASFPKKLYAFFGIGENLMLAKILVENIKQLIEIKKIVEAGEDTFKLIDDINRGINDALRLLETINRAANPGTFYQIKDLSDLKSLVLELYGNVPEGMYSKAQIVHDLTVAESFEMHNQLYDYAKQLDEAGEAMKAEANSASPGRAQKLVSQNQGALLQALAQLQRNQAQIIKLLAQNVASQNQKEKERARGHLYKYEGLKKGFKSLENSYELTTLK